MGVGVPETWLRLLCMFLVSCFFANARQKLGTNRVSWQGLATMAYVWKGAWRCAWNTLWHMKCNMLIRSVKLCFWIFHSFTLRISCDIDNSCTMLLFQVLTCSLVQSAASSGVFNCFQINQQQQQLKRQVAMALPPQLVLRTVEWSRVVVFFVFQDRRVVCWREENGGGYYQRNGQK